MAAATNGDAHKGKDFESIPVLDWDQLETDRPAFLGQLRHALVFVGFMYIKNLPVERHVADVKAQAREFFDLSLDEKLKLEMKNGASPPHFLGYSRQGNEFTKGKRDHREQVDFGNERPCTWKPGQPPYRRVWGPNQWPDLPRFRTVFEDYMESMSPLSVQFTSLSAEALGLPTDAFHRFYEHPIDDMQHRLKIIKYPAVDELPDGADNQGVGPHFDGWLTFLLQGDDLPGLQVQNRRGEWLDASPIEGTFVVNIGKGLETVTRGVAIATTHRVLNPPVGRGPRFSIPFFQNVGRDAVLGDLTFQMPEEALALRDQRGEAVVSDSGNYREVSQLNMGQTTLINRIRAHPDAGRPHYPELYAELFPDAA